MLKLIRGMRPLVYIAGPFRAQSARVPGQWDAWGIQQNIMRAADLSREVWLRGGVGVCPHTNAYCLQGHIPDADILDGDISLLSRCHALLVTDDWQRSEGARYEVQFALHEGIPVFYTLDSLIQGLNLEASNEVAS